MNAKSWVPPRGSEFYMYQNCDASYELMRRSGEEPATVFAFKGTRVHRVLAASGSIGDLNPDESKIFEELWKKFREMLRTWRGGAPVTNVWNEQEFGYQYEGQRLFIGHPDKVIQSGDRLLIPDFKTGYHPKDEISATNCQLRGYVALADANIPGVNNITVWIDKPGKTDAPALYDRATIDDTHKWVVNLINRVTLPGEKKPNRGPWCHYCSGKVICPLWQDEIQKLASTDDQVDNLPDQQLARLAPHLSIAKKVIERLEDRLKARVHANPEFFADWHFKPGRLNPEIQSVGQAWLAMKGNLDADTFLEVTKLTIGELVRIYRDANKLTWEAAREQVEKKLGANLKYTRTAPSLVYEPKQVAIPDAEGAG